MPWFNVDDSFHSHPKVLASSPAALGLWVVAGSWSSDNLTEGFVPDHVLPRLLPGSAKLARTLVTAGLWRRVQGGYRFHDWADWNATRAQVEHRREQARERQRRHRKQAGVTAYVTRDIRRDSPVSHDAQSNPQSVVHLVDHVTDRYAQAPDDDPILRTIIDSIREACSRDITPDDARLVALGILGGRQVNNPVAYVKRAIEREKRPAERFLSAPLATAERDPWCGECDGAISRQIEIPGSDGPVIQRCPRCHPLRERRAS